jgi:hypothetical protein
MTIDEQGYSLVLLRSGGTPMCSHEPTCPPADSPAHDAARLVVSHPLQGWGQLCNGVIVFADTGELSPSGQPSPPHRPEPEHAITDLVGAGPHDLVAGRRYRIAL